MKKILGLDLGTNSIGWAVVQMKQDENGNESFDSISCAKGSNGPILQRVTSIKILYKKKRRSNIVECSLYGKEYLKATVQYVLQ